MIVDDYSHLFTYFVSSYFNHVIQGGKFFVLYTGTHPTVPWYRTEAARASVQKAGTRLPVESTFADLRLGIEEQRVKHRLVGMIIRGPRSMYSVVQ